MTSLNITFGSKLPIGGKTNIVIGVVEENKSPKLADGSDFSELSQEKLGKLGASYAAESTTRVLIGEQLVVLLGTGSKPNWRELGGALARAISNLAEVSVKLAFESKSDTKAFVEGMHLGGYQFDGYKGTKPTAPKLTRVTLVTPHKLSSAELEATATIAQAVSAARDLINSPPNDIYPESLAASIKKAAKGSGATVEVWDVTRLKAEKCVGILAVGQGSARPPRLVKIDYKPKGAKKHLALVGKGITFDSGGLTLKPGPGMLGMKYDMAGAATVGHAALAIARLGLPIRVTAYLCVAENLPSGSATRPNDIIKYRNGKTVEVTNTDAEGRLVLADGLILASESKPDLIVDVATLTGAARVALGVRTAGLMGTEEGITALQKASATTGEALWAMPLPVEVRKLLDSNIADLINSKLGDPSAGMLVGGHFLKEFVGSKAKGSNEQLEWAHLDIAGPANNDGTAYGYVPKGATGVMLRTLIEVAKSL
ncbi:MAG: leucyl aminopeptidase [Microbacteriaceae bacterium]